jgi:hypothetical protein
MKFGLSSLCLALFPLLGQVTDERVNVGKTNADLKSPQREFHDDAKAAVERGEFVKQGDGYTLRSDLKLRYMARGKWTTGTNASTHSSPPPGETQAEVKIQIGTLDGKPAYVTSMVSDKVAPMASDDMVQALNASAWGKISPPNGKPCPDGSKCTKWCLNKTEKRYCCEWVCK